MKLVHGMRTMGFAGGSLLARYASQMRALQTQARADFSDLQGLEIKRLDLLMRRIVEANFDAILIIDHSGAIGMANAAATSMFGYDGAVLKGMRAERLVPGYQSCADPQSPHYCVGRGHRATLGVRADGAGFPIDLCLSETRFGDEVLMIAIVRDATELRKRERQLEHQALHDALTGLPNRALLADRLAHAVQAARRNDGNVALLMLDLDGFKEVNDTLGHHIGDMLLGELAKRLVEPVREGDTVARLGGDEFAVLLPGAEHQRAVQIAKRLRDAIMQPFAVADDLRLEVGASVGIAMFPLHAQESGKLMQCADVAMYAAKAGPAKVVSYDAAYDSSNIRQLTLAGELRRAIQDAQIDLEFQPKLNLQHGT
ncbi:MAG: sensor domain-containing diguanylate cyclase, partial [Alphaproteobacteria bacterium]